jgi:hypothetical protein
MLEKRHMSKLFESINKSHNLKQKVADDSVESIKLDFLSNDLSKYPSTSTLNRYSDEMINFTSECRPEIKFPPHIKAFECDVAQDVFNSAKLLKLRTTKYSYTCCLCDENFESN